VVVPEQVVLAAHNGTAPIPVWSGNLVRHRLDRGGNRQLNVALHRIAITQLRCPGPGQVYVAKRQAAGDTTTEATLALRRRLSDEVFRRPPRAEWRRSVAGPFPGRDIPQTNGWTFCSTICGANSTNAKW
jgi:hypothetical protein